MNKLTKVISIVAVMALTACGGGGGGGSSTGGTYFTHEQLANEFVRRMNIDQGYDLELVKDNTLQYDYIVVYDWDLDSYDAYYIGAYNPGENLWNYLYDYEYDFYYDLIPIGFNEYEDPFTGIVFEKTAQTPKDALTIAALEETLLTKKAAQTLNAQFGMSQERSLEVAELAVIWQKAPKDRMTDADHDEFATNVLGHSITEYKAAVEAQMAGDASELNKLIEDTAAVNGLSPEKANQIVNSVFGVELN